MNLVMAPNPAKTLISLLAASLALAVPRPAFAEDNSSPLALARQLNKAFVEVAERVSASVVVISVAHKPSHMDLEDQDSPFFDLPPELRKHFEEYREKNREKNKDRKE